MARVRQVRQAAAIVALSFCCVLAAGAGVARAGLLPSGTPGAHGAPALILPGLAGAAVGKAAAPAARAPSANGGTVNANGGSGGLAGNLAGAAQSL